VAHPRKHEYGAGMHASRTPQVLLAALAAIAAPSCAFIFSQEEYRPVDQGERADGITTKLPSVELGLIAVSFGAQGGSFRVPWKDAQLEVVGGGIAWDQHWFGPVLPIFPFFMGAGSTTSEVDVFVAARGGSVTLVPAEFLARATRLEHGGDPGEAARIPKLCHRVGGKEKHGKEKLLPLEEPVTLKRGQGIQLTFPLPVRVTREFELTLPQTPGSDSRAKLPFRYEDNLAFVWFLLPTPLPTLSF